MCLLVQYRDRHPFPVQEINMDHYFYDDYRKERLAWRIARAKSERRRRPDDSDSSELSSISEESEMSSGSSGDGTSVMESSSDYSHASEPPIDSGILKDEPVIVKGKSPSRFRSPLKGTVRPFDKLSRNSTTNNSGKKFYPSPNNF